MRFSPNPLEPPPVLSFGVPVRNGARFIGRLLASLEAQDYPHFEVVICDNESDDETPAIVEAFVARDSRFKYFRNETDVGQIENFNRVFARSTGRYFRWIGTDDWLEPQYARRCVETLQRNPDSIGVTTLWNYQDDEGVGEVAKYDGRRVDSKHALHRISRMLWFLQNNVGADPIYSALRRTALEKTQLLPIGPWTDRILALELAMVGPFVHVNEVLATRRNAREPVAVRLARYHKRISGKHAQRGRFAPRWTMYWDLARTVMRSGLGPAERTAAVLLVVVYCGVYHLRSALQRASEIWAALKIRRPLRSKA